MEPRESTLSEQIQALERFGYARAESHFLLLAALHGGYFLRRQFAQFAGHENGGVVTRLIHRALHLGHLRASTFRHNTQLYHLCARPFYRAIGQDHNRNRRLRELSAIKRKLMGFDFVLAHPSYHYLATDQEKLCYFTEVLAIPPEDLPTVRYGTSNGGIVPRHFVEKFPIFFTPSSDAKASVSFCFIDEGLAGLTAFMSFLERYDTLFRALKRLDLIYVSGTEQHFRQAETRFGRMLQQQTYFRFAAPLSPSQRNELLTYFEMRRSYEQGEHSTFDRAALISFRNARDAFSGRDYETLYQAWKAGGIEAVERLMNRGEGSNSPISGTFSTFLVKHDYSAFAGVVGA